MILILFVVLLLTGAGFSQTSGGTVLLGPHNAGGRGCATCHIVTATQTATGFDGSGLAAETLSPNYNVDGVNYAVITTSASVASYERRVQVCVSCHDGVIAPANMATTTTYEQAAGLAPAGSAPLLENTVPTGEHPVGEAATLGKVGVAQFFQFQTGGCKWDGVPGDCLKIAPQALNYATFAGNYGAPNIISTGHSSPVILPDGDPAKAYVACTTCHNAHGAETYRANADAPIAGSATGAFATAHSINAPYNPSVMQGGYPSSATQFCRQCHFEGEAGANEAMGISLRTAF